MLPRAMCRPRPNEAAAEIGRCAWPASDHGRGANDRRRPGRGSASPPGRYRGPQSIAPAPHPQSPQDQHLDDIDWIGQFLLAFRLRCDKPVLAAVNGVAVGAGVALALCADLRIAAASAALHPGYIRAGTSPDGGLSWTLPTLLGHEAALRFLWDPRMVPAEEACARGLVGEVVADDAFADAVTAQAAALMESARYLDAAALRDAGQYEEANSLVSVVMQQDENFKTQQRRRKLLSANGCVGGGGVNATGAAAPASSGAAGRATAAAATIGAQSLYFRSRVNDAQNWYNQEAHARAMGESIGGDRVKFNEIEID